MVHIKNEASYLKRPENDEKEGLEILGDKVRPAESRMACQIYLDESHEGMEIEIPEAAFFFEDN